MRVHIEEIEMRGIAGRRLVIAGPQPGRPDAVLLTDYQARDAGRDLDEACKWAREFYADVPTNEGWV
jgi:hypothetical protein